MPELSEKLFKKVIAISPGLLHNVSARTVLNSTRMGFGWMDLKESEKAPGILKDTIKKMRARNSMLRHAFLTSVLSK